MARGSEVPHDSKAVVSGGSRFDWHGHELKQAATWALLGISVLFLLARLARLEADFPLYLTHSDAPLTDEGWYSNAAVRSYLGQDWYLPHDVNEATIQPAFHLIQAVNFKLLGMSLETLRLPGAIMFCFLVLVVFAVLRSQRDAFAACLAVLLLVTDFHLFAYSRIALLELPMLLFVMTAALVLFKAETRRPVLFGLGAGVLLALGCLTKLTAAFALLPLLALAFVRARQTGCWALLPAFGLGVSLPLVVAYGSAAMSHSADVQMYVRGLSIWLRPASGGLPSITGKVSTLIDADPLLVAAFSLGGLFCLSRPKVLVRDHLLCFLLTLLGVYVLILLAIQNHPTRYFVPALALAAVTAAALASHLLGSGRRREATVLLVLIGVSAAVNSAQSARLLLTAEKTYLEMSEALGRAVEESVAEPLLMGNMAPQLSVATHIPAISGQIETTDHATLLRTYRPTHYVSRGPISPSAIRTSLGLGRDLVPVAKYHLAEDAENVGVYLYRFVDSGAARGTSPAVDR